MFVVIEMDGGYSGESEYVSQVFGPFKTEDEASRWIKNHPDNKGHRRYFRASEYEVLPPT